MSTLLCHPRNLFPSLRDSRLVQRNAKRITLPRRLMPRSMLLSAVQMKYCNGRNIRTEVQLCYAYPMASFNNSNPCWAVSKLLSFFLFTSSISSSPCRNTASRFSTSSRWLSQLCMIFIVVLYTCSCICGGVHRHAEYIAFGIQGTLSATMETMA